MIAVVEQKGEEGEPVLKVGSEEEETVAHKGVYERCKDKWRDLNCRHIQYSTEVRSLRDKLSRHLGMKEINDPEFCGQEGAKKLKALLPSCQVEADRRRLFRLISLEEKLIPDLIRRINELDISVS